MIVINHGAIIYDGSVENLMTTYADHKIIRLRFSSEITVNGLEKYGEVLERDRLSAVLKTSKSDIAKTTSRILNDIPVEDLSVEDVDIEDVIKKIFTG